MTRELFIAAINRCITSSAHDVSYAAMAEALRDKAADLASIAAGIDGASTIKSVTRDDATETWRMVTADDKVHYVKREVLITAFSAASHAEGKEYPWVDDAAGFATHLRPVVEVGETIAKVGPVGDGEDDEFEIDAAPIIIDLHRSERIPGWLVVTSDDKEHVVLDTLLQEMPQNIIDGIKIGAPYLFEDDAEGSAIKVAGREPVKLEQTQEDDPANRALVQGQQPEAIDEAARQRAILDDDPALTNGQPALDGITSKVGADDKTTSDAAKPEPQGKDETAFPMVKVEKSSNVAEVGYNGTELRVRFKGKGDKPGSLYAYDGVPSRVAADFMASTSAGKFLADNIKGIYPTRKIEPTES